VLTLAITVDFVVTLAEALAWNLPRLHRFGNALAIVIGVSAPAFASLIMWRARARHSHALERAWS
jgi:low affinity Fe/Cu permease